MKDSGMTILARTPEYVFARWERIFVTVWRERTPVASIETLSLHLDRMTRDHPDGYAAITIAEVSAPPPCSKVRSELASLLRRRPPLASAFVVEGSWFRVAALRSVSTAVMLVSRPPFEQQVVSTVAEAARWLESVLPCHRGFAFDVPTLVLAVHTARHGRGVRAESAA